MSIHIPITFPLYPTIIIMIAFFINHLENTLYIFIHTYHLSPSIIAMEQSVWFANEWRCKPTSRDGAGPGVQQQSGTAGKAWRMGCWTYMYDICMIFLCIYIHTHTQVIYSINVICIVRLDTRYSNDTWYEIVASMDFGEGVNSNTTWMFG